jgi:hypothetical protein
MPSGVSSNRVEVKLVVTPTAVQIVLHQAASQIIVTLAAV